MLQWLDVLLESLHWGVIAINLLGWIPRRTRRLHWVMVNLTALSWLGLGAWYGWGYCFLTDWHWEVKRRLGIDELPPSFIHYALDRWGIPYHPAMVDGAVAIVFGVVWGVAWWQWWRRRR